VTSAGGVCCWAAALLIRRLGFDDGAAVDELDARAAGYWVLSFTASELRVRFALRY